MQVNSNAMNLADYRSEIKPCPMCSSRTPSAAMDIALSGKVCKLCLGQGFIAMCKNCNGTGIYRGRTVWDGGRNEHSSTCTPCGGSGVFPVKKPADWKDPVMAKDAVPVVDESAKETAVQT
jgi:hypothetical protein